MKKELVSLEAQANNYISYSLAIQDNPLCFLEPNDAYNDSKFEILFDPVTTFADLNYISKTILSPEEYIDFWSTVDIIAVAKERDLCAGL